MIIDVENGIKEPKLFPFTNFLNKDNSASSQALSKIAGLTEFYSQDGK